MVPEPSLTNEPPPTKLLSDTSKEPADATVTVPGPPIVPSSVNDPLIVTDAVPPKVPLTVSGPLDVDELPVRFKLPETVNPPALVRVETVAELERTTGRLAVPVGIQTLSLVPGAAPVFQFEPVDHEELVDPVQVMVHAVDAGLTVMVIPAL